MTLEELMKALEAMENGSEMAEVVKGLQAEITKKNSEAKNLRDRMKTAETDAAASKKNLKKITAKLGIEAEEDSDLEKALEAFAKKLEDGASGANGDFKEMSELRSDMKRMKRELEKMQKSKEESDQLAAQERERRIKTEKERKLADALAAEKAISPAKLVKLLEGSVKVLDDDSLVFVAEDGTELNVKEGVAAFLKANPEFVANSQSAGSGGGSGAGAGTGKAGGKTYTKAEIEAMSPEEINANWDAVQASLANLK